MARLNSYYLPQTDWPAAVGDIVEISGSEAHHMLKVLRAETDQQVRLFDGEGRDGLFKLVDCSKHRAKLEATSLFNHPAPRSGVTLAVGWGKSKRRTYLFEKAVELKSLGIVFWEARRSQGAMPSSPKDSWGEKCIQAAKQCNNPHLPRIATCSDGVSGLLSLAPSYDACYLAWESPDVPTVFTPQHIKDRNALIVIGPEGGLDENEAQRLIQGGFIPVTFGDTIMRWETAATYCLSLGWFAQQESQ